jgi:hypothetical protein
MYCRETLHESPYIKGSSKYEPVSFHYLAIRFTTKSLVRLTIKVRAE